MRELGARIERVRGEAGRVLLAGVPEGLDARVVAALAQEGGGAAVLHIARDDARLARLAEAVRFFAPDLETLRLPAWDCLPYDRVSPAGEVASERAHALSRLARREGAAPLAVLTTVNAALQLVAPRVAMAGAAFAAASGAALDLERLKSFLVENGYLRVGTVREPGEFALRGGIVDVFPAGCEHPLRLDMLGDVLEGIRRFDAATQRTVGAVDRLDLAPVGEAPIDAESIARFRAGYRALFGTVGDDPLYAAISGGRRHPGMEHFLPLFHERLETVFDYLPGAAVTLDHQAEAAREARTALIAEYYEARLAFDENRPSGRADDDPPPYRPLPPDRLYLDAGAWDAALDGRTVGLFQPFAAPRGLPSGAGGAVVHFDGRLIPRFSDGLPGSGEGEDGGNVFDRVRAAVRSHRAQGRRVMIAGYRPGTLKRLGRLLAEHGLSGLAEASNWPEVAALAPGATALVTLAVEQGFEAGDLAVVTEQDVFGERPVRPRRRARKQAAFVAEIGELSAGDLVVHVEHGIGRYLGLETVVAADAPHDCLLLAYAGGDRLYVPVENLEALSRYGSGEAEAALDRLGGGAWQHRKAKLKKRLLDMAGALIEVAARRETGSARVVGAEPGLYEAFCARFPFVETDDQLDAIEDTMKDLARGRPMDRLICGDVGFGKTEIALRAAFNTVHAGGQVAVVAPTTLLCRQHFATFSERFAGSAVRIGRLSRLVGAREAAATRAGLADGTVDIVIGTHALLADGVVLRDLALLVIDEEQHFGVAHKERLKRLKSDVHVLSMTATPIPRTLQLALAGVRDMSVIATPPVDRLAVRTYVLPFDPVVVREAVMREAFRGGQVFYVCPRIGDLAPTLDRLAELVPGVKAAAAHGRMAGRALEDVMTAFYDGKIDVLVSTQIIESGLDLPRANTLIVHRADMFGLAQLYQLRGRVGRSKLRAYCYLTLPARQALGEAARKRLEAMQTLDTLGAGFALASHDLDIRGAGNLLGGEQSGHIREVGVELYQRMLEDAVCEARGAEGPRGAEPGPQIALGLPVLIPESYVSDLDVRLGLYRRVARLEDDEEIAAFGEELADRFGAPPAEVETLLQIVGIKRSCRKAGIEKIDAGPNGAVLSFGAEGFADPAALVSFIQDDAGRTRLRPDQRLVFRRDWSDGARRLAGVKRLVARLSALAA